MALILNIIWFVFGGGLVAWFLWVVLGGLLFLTVVGIPFGFAHFRLALVCFAPLGKRAVPK